MKKLAALLFIVCLIVSLYGCGGGAMVRGGFWGDDPYYCSSWFRLSDFSVRRCDNFGFRLALVPVQE